MFIHDNSSKGFSGLTGTRGENRTFFLEPLAVERDVGRLTAWATKLEVSESEVPEPEVSEVYLADEARELSQETRRELVSIGQRRLILFWNTSGEKNAWEKERPLNKDLLRAEAWMNSLSQTMGSTEQAWWNLFLNWVWQSWTVMQWRNQIILDDLLDSTKILWSREFRTV